MHKIHQIEEGVAFEIKLLERSGQKIVLTQDLKSELVETPVMLAMVKIPAFYDQIIADLMSEGRIGYSDILLIAKPISLNF